MEPAEYHVRDEDMGVGIDVLEVCRAERYKPMQETRTGKFDSSSDKTAS
jgi:hypothetical protein